MLKKPTKLFAILLSFLLFIQQTSFAEMAVQLNIAGHLANLANSITQDKFRPLHLRYLQYIPQDNSFKLLLDKGNNKEIQTKTLEESSKVLLKYFLIGLTLPNKSFWVNLRPDSPENIIDDYLAKTDIGRIMLETDLELKKDTAKATSPDTVEGKEYWDKLYKKAEELFGSQNITIPTLTRPWIVPDQIIVRETKDSAYVYKATLKVMLEEDYLKSQPQAINSGLSIYQFNDPRLKQLNEYSTQLIKELIIPKLTIAVNTSKKYSQLRQVYYSLILAQWFKSRFKDKPYKYSELIDNQDLTNLTSNISWSKDTYFKEYQKSFKDGEYSFQEPVYTLQGKSARSYFSGGEVLNLGQIPVGNIFDSKVFIPTGSSSPIMDNQKLAEINLNIDEQGGLQIIAAAEKAPGRLSESSKKLVIAIMAGLISAGSVFGAPPVIIQSEPAAMRSSTSGSVVYVSNPGSLVQLTPKELTTTSRIEALIKEVLNSPDLGVRTNAMEALAETKDPKAINVLSKALKDSDRIISYSAAWALALMNNSKATEVLVNALSDPSVFVRRNAAVGLGETKDPHVVEPLINALSDPDTDVCNSAAVALGKISNYFNNQHPYKRIFDCFSARSDDIEGGGFSPYSLFLIYQNKEFRKQTDNFHEANQFSLARAIEAVLSQLHRKIDDKNIEIAFTFILEAWKNQSQKIVINKDSRVVASFHNEDVFDPKQFAEFLRGFGINTENPKTFSWFKGTFDGEKLRKAKEGLRKSIEDLNYNVVYFDHHGGTKHLWFTAGQVGQEESDDLYRSTALSYKELAENLFNRAKKNNGKLSDLTIIISACHSADLVINNLNELVDLLLSGKITDLPRIVTATGRGTLGYQIFPSLKKVSQGKKELRLADFYEVQRLEWKMQAMTIFLFIGRDKLKELEGKLSDPEKDKILDINKGAGQPRPQAPNNTIPSLHPALPIFLVQSGRDVEDSAGVKMDIDSNPSLDNKNVTNLSASSPVEIKPGGIDFRFLPIITQAMGNLSCGFKLDTSTISRLEAVNLGQELEQLQKMTEAGITPSAERIKEYIQAACYKGRVLSEDRRQITICISDILRLEENNCYQTDPILQDILIVLESQRTTQQLQKAFLGKEV